MSKNPVYGTSSQARSFSNRDGTFNIYCTQCGRHITRAGIRVGGVLCAICQKIGDGELVGQDVMDAYGTVDAEGRAIGGGFLETTPVIPGVEPKFTLGDAFAGSFKAIGRFVTSITRPTPKRDENVPESTKIARSKRQRRIFDSVDLKK